jgi:hypothetical protein
MEAPSAMAAACRQVHRPGQAVAGDPGDRRTGPLSELVAGQLARLVDNNAQQPLGVVDEIQTDLRCRRAGRRAAWDPVRASISRCSGLIAAASASS